MYKHIPYNFQMVKLLKTAGSNKFQKPAAAKHQVPNTIQKVVSKMFETFKKPSKNTWYIYIYSIIQGR